MTPHTRVVRQNSISPEIGRGCEERSPISQITARLSGRILLNFFLNES